MHRRLASAAIVLGIAHACPAQTLHDLASWWNPTLQDNLLAAEGLSMPGWGAYRFEGLAFSASNAPALDVAPLHRWWSPSRGDYFTTSEVVWRGGPGQTRSPDYSWVGIEGWALANPYAGTCPLTNWFSPSRGDNQNTSDYALNGTGLATYGTDYTRGATSGYGVRDYFAATQENPAVLSWFRRGDLYYGSSPTGDKPLHVVIFKYADIAGGPLTQAQVQQRIFGPAEPNMAQQFDAISGGLFRWAPGEVLGPVAAVDDPDTIVREDTWAPGEDPADPQVLFLTLRASSGLYLASINAGGGTIASNATSPDDWETFAFVPLSVRDGLLVHGDIVALKAPLGQFARESANLLRADGPSGPLNTGGFPLSGQFTVEKVSGAVGTVVRNGDVVRIRSRSNNKYLRAIGGVGTQVAVDATSPTSGTDFVFGKGTRSGARLNRQVCERVQASGINFASFDANGNGVVETKEFHLLVIEKRNNPTMTSALWGQSRNPAGRFRPIGATVDVELFHSYVGEDGTLLSFGSHEIGHTLGCDHIYGHDGDRNKPFSVMAGSGGSLPQLMDPYNRIRLGWDTPRVFNLSDPGQVVTLRTSESGGHSRGDYESKPVILYDPARYNVATRSGEYFILEYRNGLAPSTRYDAAVADAGNHSPNGLALWQVKTDASGNLLPLPAEGGAGGVDPSCNHLAAPTGGGPSYVRGNWELWTDANGLIRPRYIDGTLAPVFIRVGGPIAPSNETLTIEWSNDGVLWPRLDLARNGFNHGSTSVRRGQPLYIAGAFPVGAAPTVRVDVSGPVACTLISRTPTEMTVRIPANSPIGVGQVSVANGAKTSNRLAITVRCGGDFNENGSVSSQDIFDFLTAFFASDPRADINNSGAVSPQDIFDFLAAFFTPCP